MGASEISQSRNVKVLVTKADTLSSILRIHMVETELTPRICPVI